MATGSFGPTTAGRMDSYVAELQANGGSFVMLAKGNRSKAVKDACQKYGGFYLGSVGGPAAGWRRTASARWKCLSIPNWAWKLCGKLRSRTSRRLLLSTIRAMTSTLS